MSANISIFVPHAGCKHKCSFCDQVSITEKTALPHANDVIAAAEQAKSELKDPKNAEIAFFGGSFTAIDTDYRRELLEAAYKYIDDGTFKGIRISTRPDYIDDNILNELKSYGVTSIELGAQSMDDEVLKMNLRGHTSHDVTKASSLIKEYGFELGLQMMTGLYGSSKKRDEYTAEKIAELSPDTVRIYPTVVFEHTLLAKKFLSGEYQPPGLDETVPLCAKLLLFFYNKNIPVIKLGLHAGDGVAGSSLAGAYHPALRELCEGEIYLNAALGVINSGNFNRDEKGKILLHVAPRCTSKMAGQNGRNLKSLSNLGYACKIIEDPVVKKYEVKG